MDISKIIREKREAQRLTQLDIAERLKTERSNYARLESRGEKLTIEQLQNIAGALGLGIGELLGLDVIGEQGKKIEQLQEELKYLDKRERNTNGLLWAYEKLVSNYFRKTIYDAGVKFGMVSKDIPYSYANTYYNMTTFDKRIIYREVLSKNSFFRTAIGILEDDIDFSAFQKYHKEYEDELDDKGIK